MNQKVIKVGTSAAAVIPKTILEATGLAPGSSIRVERTKDGVLIQPVDSATDSSDERVAETALSLMKKYHNALERLSDA